MLIEEFVIDVVRFVLIWLELVVVRLQYHIFIKIVFPHDLGAHLPLLVGQVDQGC